MSAPLCLGGEKFHITFEPDGRRVFLSSTTSLLEAAHQAGIRLDTPCGGEGRCGKCKVVIREGFAPPTTAERELLSDSEIAQGVRLACRVQVEENLTVCVPPSSRLLPVSILTESSLPMQPYSLDPSVSTTVEMHRDSRLAGAAVDVGTTTVALSLMDLTTGTELARAVRLNPQSAHGADVVSRLAFAAAELNGSATLQNEIVSTINEMLDEATASAGIKTDDVFEMVLVGNTAMMHLFYGLPTETLGQAPYQPATLAPENAIASHWPIAIAHAGNVVFLPAIAGFVGADTTAMALALGLHRLDGTALAVDIGTNGEIVLKSGDKLIACSTAAGPAFEGANISCGMVAKEGAIESVSIAEGRLNFSVIGNKDFLGVCGSGLIDLVAALRHLGLINESGRIIEPENSAQTQTHGCRILESEKGRAIKFYDGPPRALALTQADIRALQLGKGAIRAGIETLLEEFVVKPEGLERLCVAGAFGSRFSKQSIISIGLIPPLPPERIHLVGNAALAGAKLALLSRQARMEAVELAKQVEHVELFARPRFQELFMDAMGF